MTDLTVVPQAARERSRRWSSARSARGANECSTPHARLGCTVATERPQGRSPESRTPQEISIGAVVVRAPRLETSLLEELVRKVNVGPAIEQIPQVQTDPRQMHRVDLEIAPIQRPVGIVVVDLARAPRILGALNGQGYPTRRAEFVTGVLLIGRQTMAELIGLGFRRVLADGFGCNHEWPLKTDSDRRLKAECVLAPQYQDGESRGHCHKQHHAAKNRGDRRLGRARSLWGLPAAHVAAPVRDCSAGRRLLCNRFTSPEYYGAAHGVVYSRLWHRSCQLAGAASITRHRCW